MGKSSSRKSGRKKHTEDSKTISKARKRKHNLIDDSSSSSDEEQEASISLHSRPEESEASSTPTSVQTKKKRRKSNTKRMQLDDADDADDSESMSAKKQQDSDDNSEKDSSAKKTKKSKAKKDKRGKKEKKDKKKDKKKEKKEKKNKKARRNSRKMVQDDDDNDQDDDDETETESENETVITVLSTLKNTKAKHKRQDSDSDSDSDSETEDDTETSSNESKNKKKKEKSKDRSSSSAKKGKTSKKNRTIPGAKKVMKKVAKYQDISLEHSTTSTSRRSSSSTSSSSSDVSSNRLLPPTVMVHKTKSMLETIMHRPSSPLVPDDTPERTGKFSQYEIDSLSKAIAEYLTVHDLTMEELLKSRSKINQGAWTAIASGFPTNRSVKSLYDCARRKFYPGKTGKWSQDEVDKLAELVHTYGRKWVKISDEMDRLPSACRDKWRDTRVSYKSGVWTPQEVKRLEEAVHIECTKKGIDEKSTTKGLPWAKISRRMEDRSEEQCRHFWISRKKPNRKPKEKTMWSQEETLSLLHVISTWVAKNPTVKFSRDIAWSELATSFEG
eukprot:TRINITY_DN2193_c0_g1_i11.p1 TRINITY_DN2193_c0_g1~~TRINITY_DN2193_c0_g1_i11.p1  ORF type:complete len:556 (+),score=210.66 TRINITY_DN2193_c0_g1_i11:662-2329(+)